MDALESALAGLDGGRVLDVATQQGGFVQILMDNLESYTEIVGIDVSEKAIEKARGAIEAENIRFSVMNAEDLEFEDGSFDTVSISMSLHHMTDILKVLGEMERVLKPGGHFIVLEMHGGAVTEPERTSAQLHGWAAEIDRVMGTPHNPVMARDDVLGHAARLGTKNMESRDWVDTDSDPMESSTIEHVEKAIGMLTTRAEGLEGRADLVERAKPLRERVRKVGALREPMIVITGEK